MISQETETRGKKRTTIVLRHAICARQDMNQLWTKKSALIGAYLPSFSGLQNSHAFVHNFHLLSGISHATSALCTPYIQQENDASGKRGELWRKSQPIILGCYGRQRGWCVPGNAKKDIVGNGGVADPPRVRMSELHWYKLRAMGTKEATASWARV